MHDIAHMEALIFTHDVSVHIGGHNVCCALKWQVNPGERWAILGKNGVGKSTLLKTLAGLRLPESGELTLCGAHVTISPIRPAKSICGMPAFQRDAQRILAKQRGYLTQHHSDPFPSTVMETALIGRHPHLGRWDWESTEDHEITRTALAEVDLAGFAEREVQTLSGGERQRLAIAQLLTQRPQLFLLDEPLTHLDLSHQVAIMELFKRKTQNNAAMIAVLHDPGFAMRYCEHALLLFGQGEWLAGPAHEIITAENLSRLYGYPLREIGNDNDRWFIPC